MLKENVYRCRQLLADNTTRENMNALVKTEHEKVTEIKNISKGTKVLSVTGTTLFSAVTGIAFLTGLQTEAIAVMALTAGNLALTGHWVTHDLTKNIRSLGVDGNFKSSVFDLWGKKKSYPVTKAGKDNTVINAELFIGRGQTHLVEHIPVEPLDLWDSSMSAVRDLYKLERGSSKNSHHEEPYDYGYGYGYDSTGYSLHNESSYDWNMQGYYAQLDEIKAQEEKIEYYRKQIEARGINANCQVERLKEKQKKMFDA